MVQAKSKLREKTVHKFFARIRGGYLPWLAQNIRGLRPDSVFSTISAMREVRISRPQFRRHQRQGPVLEQLEQRIYMSALPTPFANIDIGSPSTGGSAIYVSTNNQWQITGAGTGITGTSDQFNYTSESWIGSGSLTADVGAVTDTGANAQAGVMIRDTNATGSSFAAVVENSSGTISFEYRNGSGTNVVVSTTSSSVSPAWVKLSETQSSNTDSFTGLYSTDGVHWTTINTTPVNIVFSGTTSLAGLAVTSGNASQTQTVDVNNFSATSADTAPGSTTTASALTLPPDNSLTDGTWTQGQSGGSGSGTGSVTSVSGGLLMSDGNSALVTLSHTFAIPADQTPSTLQFSFSNLTFNTTATTSINDAFEMALLNSSGTSVVILYAAINATFVKV